MYAYGAMRTTIEIKAEHRARLLELAARKGEKGFSGLISEALEAYLDAQARAEERRKQALALKGAIRRQEAEALRAAASSVRSSWR